MCLIWSAASRLYYEYMLFAGLLLAARVHCDSGPDASDCRRLLANGLGAQRARDCDAHADRREAAS